VTQFAPHKALKSFPWDKSTFDERVVLHRVEASGLTTRKVDRYKATWKREFKLPWREAGPPNHHDDKVDSDQ